MKKGLVSVTFRELGCDEIVKLCADAELKYIEWGGDIHVPAGDTENAGYVARICSENGLVPVGYGSYYNAGSDISGFLPVLGTARALSAGYIRIWAGKNKKYDPYAKENIELAVKLAAADGIAVSLECHRGTMTEDPELAVKLAEECGCRLHFQPNPDISFEKNLAALTGFRPYLCACHVFAWDKGNVRLPLSAHADRWKKYAQAAGDVPFMLEFTAGDDVKALMCDAKTLSDILTT